MARGERVFIVEGCRTPFLRSSTDFTDMTACDLGRAAVAGLLHRTRVDPALVDLLVLGTVIQDPRTSNLAREVGLGCGLPESCPAYTVTVACVSSLQAAVDGVRAIQCGDADVVIAAGAETMSDAPIRFRRPVRKALIAAQKARGTWQRLRIFGSLKLSDWLPDPPAIAEFTTGESMGQAGERLAKRLGIGREEQDAFAAASHQRAARATADGLLARQIVPVMVPGSFRRVSVDNGVRGDTDEGKLARLKPAFDRRSGTITAGNASFLSDGAAAVLLMSERKVSELGVEPLAEVVSSAVVALDPLEELLLGPAVAAPRALALAGLSLEEVEVVELHEAFAAQVLAVLKVLEDKEFCRERLGRPGAVGRVDRQRLNAWGGSLSVGHPFGATGARLLTTCGHRLRHERGRHGLVAACAAGGIGIAMVLERA
ncbi:MAG: acetyl-CoA C-acyltransferase [Acidobacteriota bacterium]|jgi:acetyl-CoA acyltransferase